MPKVFQVVLALLSSCYACPHTHTVITVLYFLKPGILHQTTCGKYACHQTPSLLAGREKNLKFQKNTKTQMTARNLLERFIIIRQTAAFVRRSEGEARFQKVLPINKVCTEEPHHSTSVSLNQPCDISLDLSDL